MDHQFLNIDCRPPPLPRPTPHPSYGGPTGGMYPLDVRQSPDVAPPINQFNPYRLSSTADGNSHSTLPSSQFVLDSFYKAYQSAYGQNSALAAAGAMFGHPSYRLDNTMLSADQQLMLQASFLQYPHLGMFPNPALYASLPGSSTGSRYHGDYFGQNLPNLSSFQNPSKYSSNTDLTPATSWMGFDRASSSASMMNNFIATSLSSDSIKDDNRISDSPFKKMNNNDQINYGNHQASNAVLKRKSTEDISLMFRQYSSSAILDEKTSKKGNGELVYSNRKIDEKKLDSYAQSGKESSCQIYHNQKRSSSISSSLKVPKSPAFSSVSCSDSAHINDGLSSISENSEQNCSFNYRNESKIFHHAVEPLNLQSKVAPGVTAAHQYSDKKSSENFKHDISNLKLSKSDSANTFAVRSSIISGTDSKDMSSYHPSSKAAQIYECKFHRPFELAPEKLGHEVVQTRNKVEAIPKSISKTLSDDHKNEKDSNSTRLPHRSLSLCSNNYGHESQNASKTFPCNVSTLNSSNSSVVSSQMCSSAKKSSGAGLGLKSISSKSVKEEVPLNLALIKDSERLSAMPFITSCSSTDTNVITTHKLVSKLDFEAAWRHAKGVPKYWKCSPDKSGSEKFDDCDFDYELKMARLTTIISGPKLSTSNNSPEKIDFLSTLGLSTVDKCKEIEFEKNRRRKFQARELSVSPTLLDEDENIESQAPSYTVEFSSCSEDCPHNNGLDKQSMLALLGLSYTGSCNPRSENYLVHGKSNLGQESKPVSLYEPLPSSLASTLLSYHNHSSLSYSLPLSDSFYSAESSSLSSSYPSFSSQSIYPSSQLPSSSIYSFYSATSQPYALNQSSFVSPSYRHHLYETPPKVTPSYTCPSNHLLDEQLYYQQGKEDRNYSKMEPTMSIEGSSYVDYNNYNDHNFLDVSLENVVMSRCISSTPASHHRENLRNESNDVCENAISLENNKNTIDSDNNRANQLDINNLFNWPGIDSIIESYHHYIEERSMEKQLLSEHSVKLSKINSDLFDAQEELKNKIYDLRNAEIKLNNQRTTTQSQIESLKNVITQLK